MTIWSKRSCVLVATLAIGGCTYEDAAHFPSQEELFDTPEAADVFVFRADTRFFTVKVEGLGLYGPEFQLSLYGEPEPAVRGSIGRRLIDLDVSSGPDAGSGRVKGPIGGTPFDLTVHRDCAGGNASCEDGVLSATGLVETRDADFRLGPRELVGRVGRCSYQLHRADRLTYEGIRTCGGDPMATSVRIPLELKRWPTPGFGAAVAILLANSD